jgi:hypothetical protein
VGFGLADLARLLEQLQPRFRSDGADWHVKDNTDPKWRLLMVAGMWFQDLFNFDFDVIGMDPARVLTLQGEISFCAHNSAGWRQVLEHVHKTASLGEWHKTHGRHRIYANGTVVPLHLVAAKHDRMSTGPLDAGT